MLSIALKNVGTNFSIKLKRKIMAKHKIKIISENIIEVDGRVFISEKSLTETFKELRSIIADLKDKMKA